MGIFTNNNVVITNNNYVSKYLKGAFQKELKIFILAEEANVSNNFQLSRFTKNIDTYLIPKYLTITYLPKLPR